MFIFTGYDVGNNLDFLFRRRNNQNVLFLCFNSLLATTSADGTAKIWRTSDFVCQYELKHDKLLNWVWDCAFTSDSLFLVTGLKSIFANLVYF